MTWQKLTATTIPQHLRKLEDETFRKRIEFNLLKSRGRIVYNCSGDTFDWRVRYRKFPSQTNNGEQTLIFTRQNEFKKAELGYTGLVQTDSFTESEQLANRGDEAIVKYTAPRLEQRMQDLREDWCDGFYIDSSATGNSDRMSGLETMFACNGTITISSGAQRTANAADIAGFPNDTYASLTTNLGDAGGTWATQSAIASTWPNGKGDAAYEYWSPIVLNYTSTAWGGATATWAANCVNVTRFGISQINDRCGAMNPVDLVILDRDLYRQWKSTFDSKERITNLGEKLASGFTGDSIEFDGATITGGFGVTSGVGYILSMSNVEYRSRYKQIFQDYGPKEEIRDQAFLTVVKADGQFKFSSPKNFGKMAALA